MPVSIAVLVEPDLTGTSRWPNTPTATSAASSSPSSRAGRRHRLEQLVDDVEVLIRAPLGGEPGSERLELLASSEMAVRSRVSSAATNIPRRG